MEQSISSSQPKRIQGALMILGAVAVGVGSGIGLNFIRPDHKDPLSAAEQTQQEEAAEAQPSSSAEPVTASAAVESESVQEPSSAESTPTSADEVAAADPSTESDAAQSFGSSESEQQTTSDYSSNSAEPEPPAEELAATGEPHQSRAPASPSVARHSAHSAPPPASQVLRPWWNATSADPFGVQYVGQVDGQHAIAVLFSGDIGNAGNIGDAIKLVDESGKPITGGWKVANNPRLIVRSDLKPGRYTLAFDGQLASASGQSLRTPLRGPVYVQ